MPYVFEDPTRDRTSHYLIFISKDPLGYRVMKEIMYKESSRFNQGVAHFGHVRSAGRKKTPLLDFINRPLDDLCDELCEMFAGQTVAMEDVYLRHQAQADVNAYVKKNYKAALLKLEDDERITAKPPREARRKRKGQPTFGDDKYAIFPPKEK